MEVLEQQIAKFLDCPGAGDCTGAGAGYGAGYGNGTGYGTSYGAGARNGDGYGDGNGNGAGYGAGAGNGAGARNATGYGGGNGDGADAGYGAGFRDGIFLFCAKRVYSIDGLQTIITNVHGNIAKGYTICDDFTKKSCYIAKFENCFAHGNTMRSAMRDAQNKHIQTLNIEQRIGMFVNEFPNPNLQYPVSKFYDWHNTLTGSCEFGRKQFAQQHCIDIERDKMTVADFIKLTKNAYGDHIIKQLEIRYETK